MNPEEKSQVEQPAQEQPAEDFSIKKELKDLKQTTQDVKAVSDMIKDMGTTDALIGGGVIFGLMVLQIIRKKVLKK